MAGEESQAPLKAAVSSLQFCLYSWSEIKLWSFVNMGCVTIRFRAMMICMQTRAMRGMKATTARAKGKFAPLLSVTEQMMHHLVFLCFFL